MNLGFQVSTLPQDQGFLDKNYDYKSATTKIPVKNIYPTGDYSAAYNSMSS